MHLRFPIPFAYVDECADERRSFRQTPLTTLASRVRTAVRAARPGAAIGVAVPRDPTAKLRDHLQDWRMWMDHGLIDAVSTRQGSFSGILSSYDGLFQLPPALAPTVAADARSR